ncbi:MAG TPA: CorA family divalent cation transporter, partial [Miltoncostaeaceae bacterium]|nr:CorA family divalent cation transporter [Miltoncostaeaceae bacterium]
QEIINYRRIVKPQRTTLRLLDRNSQRFAPQDLELYFDDIVDKSERIWDLLENYKEVAEALEATNESVISHRVNDILRALTAISVIVLPLTLIASVFGMNVGLPGGGDPVSGASATFWAVVGVMLAILIGMVAYFRYKRWL